MKWVNQSRRWSLAGIFLWIGLVGGLFAQDIYDESGEQTFWDDSTDTSYYYAEDSLYYPEDSLYYAEDSLYYYEGDSLYYDTTGIEYAGDEYYDENGEPLPPGELSDLELADQARKLGYTITITGSSPGFVNHSLMTYNSNTDYRVSVDFPLLMQILGIRFRFGVEVGTFAFKNYLPIGGEYAGNTLLGLVSFPAGPGLVRFGAGKIGGFNGFIAENSYGFAVGNVLGIRVGIRSTTSLQVKNSKKATLGTTSWLDGFISMGFNL